MTNFASESRSCETRPLAGLIGDFIAANERKPWQPGSVDCCLALADWAVWLGYRDPAPHLRGAYDSEDGFREIIAAHGGVVPLVASCADTIGTRIDAPAAGAIGVIGARNNITRQFGAIYDGDKWLVRTARGFEPVTAPTLAIWRL